MLRIPDSLVRHSILVLVQEIKRDIIFLRMQLQEPLRQEVLGLEYMLTYCQAYANSPHYLNIKTLCKIMFPSHSSKCSLILLSRLSQNYK